MKNIKMYTKKYNRPVKFQRKQKKLVPNSLQFLLHVPTTSKNNFKQRFTHRVAGNTSNITKQINKTTKQSPSPTHLTDFQ